MPRKTPGKLQAPPPQAEFDALPVERLTRRVAGTFCRLHSLNRLTGEPWDPLHWSTRGTTRFDPKQGTGTLYVAGTLSGALMEVFDDQWGPIGGPGRSLTTAQLREWWVTLVDLPAVALFDATGGNLSKLGTDAQLVTGDHAITREWALRLMLHPHEIGGILYASRHHLERQNVALFRRPALLPGRFEAALAFPQAVVWIREPEHGRALVHGPAALLETHPELMAALTEMEVSILP